MKKVIVGLALASMVTMAAPVQAVSPNANCVGKTASTVGAWAIIEAIRAIGGRLFGEVASTNCDPDFE